MSDEVTYIEMLSRWDGATYQYFTDEQDTSTNIGVIVTLSNGDKMSVPMDLGNSEYKDIAEMLADGDITIADAD